MRCPECGSERVDHEGPGPGQGGLFRLSCHDCGHEEAGICDPGRPDAGVEPGRNATPEGEPRTPHGPIGGSGDGIAGRCEVCGKPGLVRNLPGGVPVSGCFCEEHAPAFTLKPLPVLLGLAVLLVVVWLVWC